MQVINLSLSDFSVVPLVDPSPALPVAPTPAPGPAAPREEPRCTAYAILREKSVHKSLTVCGGKRAEGHIYTSITPVLEIIILGNTNAQPSRHFLLNYKCEDKSGSRFV